MKIGYARVSTPDQVLDLQVDALRNAGCTQIFSDKVSGIKAAKPGLDQALEILRPGDTLVIWKLDRLGRSVKGIIELLELFDKRGVHLESVIDKIDTSTAGGTYFVHTLAALAEAERNMIRERTMAGLEAARARGHHGGRPRITKSPKVLKTLKLAQAMHKDTSIPISDIVDSLRISRTTLYRYLKVDLDNIPK